MNLYKRVLTQLDGKMGPALRVAYMDGKDCSRQSICISTIPGGHSKQHEHACMDAGSRATQGAVAEGCGSFASEKAPLGVARCSFGIAKQRASRLDWHFFRGNSNNLIRVNRP